MGDTHPGANCLAVRSGSGCTVVMYQNCWDRVTGGLSTANPFLVRAFAPESCPRGLRTDSILLVGAATEPGKVTGKGARRGITSDARSAPLRVTFSGSRIERQEDGHPSTAPGATAPAAARHRVGPALGSCAPTPPWPGGPKSGRRRRRAAVLWFDGAGFPAGSCTRPPVCVGESRRPQTVSVS